MAEERNVRKVRVGKVVSNKMDKTVVVAVERKVVHFLKINVGELLKFLKDKNKSDVRRNRR